MIQVNSEIGTLKRVLIHSPDGGIGKIVPRKAQELLYEDIVDLPMMQREYDFFVKILLYFLDYNCIKGETDNIPGTVKGKTGRPQFFIPGKAQYFNSDKVVDTQCELIRLLQQEELKIQLVTSICAIENSTQFLSTLLQLEPYPLAKALITGYHPIQQSYIFPPIPNFIFTRDISVVVKDHLLLSKFAYRARQRESFITKFIAQHVLFGAGNAPRLIELTESADYSLLSNEEQEEAKVSIEGGDVMMISPNHLIVGCSQRTSAAAVEELVKKLFTAPSKDGAPLLDKVSVIKIPPKRDWMHIDTIFSHIRRNVWLLYGPLTRVGLEKRNSKGFSYANLIRGQEVEDKVKIFHFDRNKFGRNKGFDPFKDYSLVPQGFNDLKTMEDLCRFITHEDFGHTEPPVFIYSGNKVFPFDEREQWTDACNMLVLKEGVAIGYDRNHKTLEAFQENGFKVAKAQDLVAAFESGKTHPDKIENTIITLPSSELSRARGGSHCMSMPLLRAEI